MHSKVNHTSRLSPVFLSTSHGKQLWLLYVIYLASIASGCVALGDHVSHYPFKGILERAKINTNK